MFEFIRFCCIGLCAAVTHYTIALALYQHYDTPLSLSNLIAFCIALWVSYFGHKLFTFRTTSERTSHTFLKFVIVASLGFLFNEGFLLLSHNFFATLPIQLLIATAIIFTAVLTFFLNKFFTFKTME
ncbi:GtrA family protein [Acinetobacter nectaris]|uniref:GtrA family protein n=1 Tax=Acinetobacter nectaris TaxID=1219382 RepID=UPI001F463F2E|nr:GtrA family protein [Acinetobacter nectaris]MCF8998637.1 GtrA family protein [Acinetobacter nectaris]MCF9027751.1 GtrA family protein [Acinetobacter nectaris]